MSLPAQSPVPQYIGTLDELAIQVGTTLLSAGSSVLPHDVLQIIKTETLFYMGYCDLDAHVGVTLPLVTDDLRLNASEWAVIQPVVIAGCKLLQAERMEASGSIGAERFGLDVGTAQQLYDTARLELPNNAFVQPPYSLNFDEGYVEGRPC